MDEPRTTPASLRCALLTALLCSVTFLPAGAQAATAPDAPTVGPARTLSERWLAAVNRRDRAWLRAHSRTDAWRNAIQHLSGGVVRYDARVCDRRDIIGSRLPRNQRACAAHLVFRNGDVVAGGELYLVWKDGRWQDDAFAVYD